MTSENPSLWRLIPLTDYAAPAEPTTQTLRNNFNDLVKRLRTSGRSGQDIESVEPAQELESIPSHLIEQAAPEPDWRTIYFEALMSEYRPWLDADAARAGVRVLVNAPHSNLPKSAIAWAADNGLHLIEPPTPRQILDRDDAWFEQVDIACKTRWILPLLEHCYLRHQNGLYLLRGWLDRVAGQGAGMVVCDSWAWAFLSQTLHLDQIFPHVRTLAPLDANALAGWFQQSASNDGGIQYTFRQAHSGHLIFTHSDEDDHEEGGESETKDATDYFKYLAAHSRGIPETAWQIWLHGLLVESDGEVEEEAEEKAASDRGKTIWVRPWEKVELPTVPGFSGTLEAFVLHALLLHDGLSDALLARLLPLMPFEIASCIQRLQTANLITDDAGCRRVTCLGYPAVRAFLRSEGFLIDEL